LTRIAAILLFTQKNLSYEETAEALKEVSVRLKLRLTVVETPDTRVVMTTTTQPTLRLVAAMLLTVTVIGLTSLAMRAPTQTQSPVTLKSIQTDTAVTLYADHRPSCAWFVEMVLPTGDTKLADHRPSCAWFVEMVLPTGDSKLMTENLQSV